MIVAGEAKDLVVAVHIPGAQLDSGTVYCVIRLESDDSEDTKYWDGDSWETSPSSWPTATHIQSGLWVYELPAEATEGKEGDRIHFIFTDNLTEASATTFCLGKEYGVYSGTPTTNHMVPAGVARDVMAAVHNAITLVQVATGTIYCVVRLESDDADDGKFWDANDDTWQAAPVAWPTATHLHNGLWVYELPIAATSGKAGASLQVTFTDNITEASATTVCFGTEYYVYTPSASLCMIYGTLLDVAGDPLIGTEVDAYATTPQVVGGAQMGSRIAAATTDALGYFELELERGAEVRFSIEDAGLDETRTVPDAASQDLATWT